MVLMCWAQLSLTPEWQRNLEDYDVYRARTLAVADNGNVVVIDRDASAVLILDDQGNEVARLTANGQGPGEFQSPVEVCWSPVDQTFAVLDYGNSRLSKWSPRGEWIADYPAPTNVLHPRFVDEDTYLVTRNAGGMAGPDLLLLRVELGETDGEVLWQYQREERIDNTAADMGGEQVIRILFRWDPFLLYGTAGDLLATAYGNQSQINLLNVADGDRRRPPVRLALPRYEVTDQQIDNGVELMPANMHAAIRRGLVRPDHWPPIRAVHVDEQQRIWVFGSSREMSASCPVRVLSKTGDLLGEGWVADVVLDVRNDSLYYITEREDGLWLGKVKASL